MTTGTTSRPELDQPSRAALDDGPVVRVARSLPDRVFAWFPVALVPLVAAMAFRARFVPVNDPDSFWHLRLGTSLMETSTFVGPEPWSSLASRPLVLHEWAPQLLMSQSYEVGGYPALAWLQAMVPVVLLLTLYLAARRFASPLIAVLVALAGFGGASGSIALRPQVVTFVLVAVFTATWLQSSRDGRARWWLVPLTWVWACSHGMWFVGVAIGGAVLLGSALDRTLGRRELGRFAVVITASLVVAALTPLGLRTVTTAGGMSAYTRYVAEWASPGLLLHQTVLSLALALMVLVIWLRRRATATWVEIGLWLAGVAFTLLYLRTIAIGATMLTVLAASVLGSLAPRSGPRTASRRGEAVLIAAGVAAAVLLLPLGQSAAVAGPGGVPDGLDSRLDALPESSVVFNAYELGGWLLWRHPGLDPVVDGRADVYSVSHFDAVMQAYVLGPAWDSTVRTSGASVAVLPSGSPLAEALVLAKGWAVAAESDGYQLLEAPDQG